MFWRRKEVIKYVERAKGLGELMCENGEKRKMERLESLNKTLHEDNERITVTANMKHYDPNFIYQYCEILKPYAKKITNCEEVNAQNSHLDGNVLTVDYITNETSMALYKKSMNKGEDK